MDTNNNRGFKRHSPDILNTETDAYAQRAHSPSVLYPAKKNRFEKESVKEKMANHQVCEDATKKYTGSECKACKLHALEDKRNMIYCLAIQEELKYVQPCMRTRAFCKIMNFIDSLKTSHTEDIELTETERT